MIFSRDIGIDLGTANTIICDKKGRIIIREPSVVAVDVKTKRVLATGDEAKTMIGRTPGSIIAVRPLQEGVIADFDMTSDMLKSFIFRSSRRNIVTRTRVVVSVPSGVTEVERRAVEDAVRSAGAQDVELIEESMAAAIGAGLPVFEATGSMIVDIGGGTTDVAVVSLGGIVLSESIKVAGDVFDESLIRYVRKRYNLLIGDRTAEEIKTRIGEAYHAEDNHFMDVKGRDLVTGLPATVRITSQDTLEAFKEPLSSILDAIHGVLEKTPPELAADIMDRGIVMTGGGSMLHGMDRLIQENMGIDAFVADDAISCVAIGTGKYVEYMTQKY